MGEVVTRRDSEIDIFGEGKPVSVDARRCNTDGSEGVSSSRNCIESDKRVKGR